ncbi:hypothetical protein VYU27_008249 [Nannochloropsis oceanica]
MCNTMTDKAPKKKRHQQSPFMCQGEVNEVMRAFAEDWGHETIVRALATKAQEAGPSVLKVDRVKNQLVQRARDVIRDASLYVYSGLFDKRIEMRVHTKPHYYERDGRIVICMYRTRRRRARGARTPPPFKPMERPPAKEDGGGQGQCPFSPTNKPASNLIIIHCFFAVCLLVLVAFIRLPTAHAFHHGPSFPPPFPSSFSSGFRPRALSPSLPPSFCQSCLDNNEKIVNFLMNHQRANRKIKNMRIQQQRHQQQWETSKRRPSYLGDLHSPALTLPFPLSPLYLASVTDNLDNDNLDNFNNNNNNDSDGNGEDEDEDINEGTGEEKPDLSASFLINFLSGYKQFISPLLPKACRFFPTCSEYAIESIQTFGAAKGIILTVWRLLRCNPLGGRGWDPPQWPPPGWFAGGTGR